MWTFVHCFLNFFFNYIILVNVLDESNICFITDTTFNLKQCFIYKKKTWIREGCESLSKMFLKNYKYTCTKKYENPNQMGM